MWTGDTRRDRLGRYEEYLKRCPTLYEPAGVLRGNGDTARFPGRDAGPGHGDGGNAGHAAGVSAGKLGNADGSIRAAEKETTADKDGTVRGREHPSGAPFDSGPADTDVRDYVLAPALSAYVLWVLREALRSGKRRLYFLARDGYLMYRAAELLCRELGLPIECRYLCCSRYSVRIPVFHLDYRGALDYICRGGIDVTMHKVFNRAGIPGGEQEAFLERVNRGLGERGRHACRMGDRIPHAGLAGIRAVLEEDARFRQRVTEISREAMPALEGYLRQEGLLDDVPVALVDSGWVGSMQKVLGQVLAYMRGPQGATEAFIRAAEPGRRLEGYYWGLYELPAGVNREDYHAYYFAPEGGLREKVYFSNCLFECVFSAPHGMTLGYGYRNGKYVPVFGKISEENRRFIIETERRLVPYTRILAESLREKRSLDCPHGREAVRNLLHLFMGEPTREEAAVYGRLSFSDDVLDDGMQRLAADMTQGELAANHAWRKILSMLGIRHACVKESAWYEGSAVNGGKDVERHLRRYARYKYLLYLRKQREAKKQDDGLPRNPIGE